MCANTAQEGPSSGLPVERAGAGRPNAAISRLRVSKSRASGTFGGSGTGDAGQDSVSHQDVSRGRGRAQVGVCHPRDRFVGRIHAEVTVSDVGQSPLAVARGAPASRRTSRAGAPEVANISMLGL